MIMGPDAATPLNPPALKQIIFDGNSVLATWEPGPDSGNFFEITLFEGDKQAQSTNAMGFTGVLLNVSIDLAKAYTVKVAQTDSSYSQTGPYSNEIALIKTAPSIIHVNYDGTKMYIKWDSPDGQPPLRGAKISLFEKSRSKLIFSDDFDGFHTFLTPNPLLDPSLEYFITVAGVNPGSTGPSSSPVDIIQKTVQINSVIYDGIHIHATASSIPPPPLKLNLFLYADDEWIQQSDPSPDDFVVLTVNKKLVVWQHYEVMLAFTNSNSRGPLSKPAAVIPGIPILRAIAYDGAKIKASWTNPPGNPVPTGGAMILFEGDTPVNTIDVIGDNGVMELNGALDPDKNYDLRVAATFGPSRGSNSAPLAIISSIKQITEVAYDGERIMVTWPPGLAYGVSEYLLSLMNNGAVIATQNAGDGKGIINRWLDPGSNYNVRLQATGNKSTGPSSSAPVIASPARVAEVDTLPDSVHVLLDNGGSPAGGTVTGYRAFLYRDDEIIAGPIAAGGTPPAAVFNYKPQSPYTYNVRAQATGANCSGPLSSTEAVISGAPVIESISCHDVTAFIQWSAVPEKAVTGYIMALDNDTTGESFSYPCTSTFISVSVTPGNRYSIRVRAAGNKAVGMSSQTVRFQTEKLDFTRADYDGGFITAAWPASTIPGASYELLLSSDNAVFMTFPASTNHAVIPAVLDPNASYSLQVRVVNDIFTGPSGNAFTIISAVPDILSVTAETGKVTVVINDTKTKDKPGVTSCQAFLFHGDEIVAGPVTAAGTPLSAVFDYPIEKYHSYSVRARAAGTGCAGPFSGSSDVVSDVPAIIDTFYDGSNITVCWSPVTTVGITGYTTILTPAKSPAHPVIVNTTNTFATIPLVFSEADGTYSLCVRAFRDHSAGPCCIAVDPIGAGLRLSTNKTKAAAVKPMSNSLPPQPFEIICYLPELYRNPPVNPPSSGPFVITAISGAGDFKYKISFAPPPSGAPDTPSAWTFDGSPVRSDLLQSYQTFLLSLEGKAPVLSGALQTVIDQIAKMMPQTFAETLFYHYGLVADKSYVDLRAGMRLQVEYQQWQTVISQSPQCINGYTGNSTAEYDIGSYLNGSGIRSIGFNSFLSGLSGLSVPTPASGGSGPTEGGGGVIDLFFQEFQRPFYRLFYPSAFKASSQPGSGYPKDNAMILAAADWSTLSDITEKIVQGASIPAAGTNYALLYMRGRAVMTPLICISVNGSRLWVPVGTTLAQVLEQYGIQPYNIPASIRGLRYLRLSGEMYAGISGQTSQLNTGCLLPVRFQAGPSVIYSNFSTWFDLPALQGDQITIAGDKDERATTHF
jgi:hypothetical protein